MLNTEQNITITPKNVAIMTLLGTGLSGRQIAKQLGVTESAVYQHKQKMERYALSDNNEFGELVGKVKRRFARSILPKSVKVYKRIHDDYIRTGDPRLAPSAVNAATQTLRGMQVLVDKTDVNKTEIRGKLELTRQQVGDAMAYWGIAGKPKAITLDITRQVEHTTSTQTDDSVQEIANIDSETTTPEGERAGDGQE